MSEIQPRSPPGYADFLAGLRQRIRMAQVRAAVAVNQELVLLYKCVKKVGGQ